MARTGHNTFLTAGLFLLDTPGALLGRDVHLGIAARRGSIDSGHNSFSVAAQNRPLGIAKNDDGDFPSRQVLLIAKVFVRSQQQFKTCSLGCIEEIAVDKPFPAAFKSFHYDMTFKGISQRCCVL